MALFQNTIIKVYAPSYQERIDKAYTTYKQYFFDKETQENICKSKEEQFQEGFLRELFVKVLGYTLNPSPNYNLITEQKNATDAKKADGAILVNGDVAGVIELKDHKTVDLKKIEDQAFKYRRNHRNARYVITSNFEKLRFYIDNAVDFEEFNLFELTCERFTLLWLCLAYENIKSGLPLQMKSESVSSEDKITKQLYKEYSEFKRQLFSNLEQLNPQYDRLTLFKKSQKLLDRFLFILFAEDSGLLPANSIIDILNQWHKLKELDEYRPLYERLKKYFGYMNTGHKGKRHEIFAYNGGLFQPDEVLDNVLIDDKILEENVVKIARYDFASEVDVNILGHIFENSLTEIEEVANAIENNTDITQTSKRKKDGVFYTPRYITTYIVENTVGKLCNDKKIELGLDKLEYFDDDKKKKLTKQQKDRAKDFGEKIEQYRQWLLELTVCDPACGSGAFLNAALDYLIAEHRLADEMESKVFRIPLVFNEVENSILENNLYGVDINEESIEIAKLSLWLRTAKPHRKLNSLSNNIKCGNSLIDDPEVAGDKAFCWEKEFPHVFKRGGFDVVIGNPPWGAKVSKVDKVFINEHYVCKKGELETYVHFIDLTINRLLTNDGLLGLITPNTWYYLDKYYDLRYFLLKRWIITLVELEKRIFADAPDIIPAIFFIRKIEKDEDFEINSFVLRKGNIPSFLIDSSIMNSYVIKKSDIQKFEDLAFNLTLTKNKVKLLLKIASKTSRLNQLYNVRYGIKTGNNDKYVKREIDNEDGIWKLCIPSASVIKKYSLNWEGDYLNFGKHLSGYSENSFERPKILVQYIRKLSMDTRLVTTLDKTGSYYPLNNFSFIESFDNNSTLEYLLTVINSKLMNFYFKNIFIDYNIKPKYLEKIPIKNTPLSAQQPYIEKADQMLSLNSELHTKRQRFIKRLSDNFEDIKITRTLESFDESDFKQFLEELKKQKIALTLIQQDEWEDYFNQYKQKCNSLSETIAKTDNEIDQMVYKLYNLTDEEIAIVEGKN